MKRNAWIIVALVCTAILGACTKQTKQVVEENKVVLAYVTSWSDVMPDPTYLTHINYAFGHVDSTFTGLRINEPERLKQIVALKQQKPTLKVILSVGGWGSGNFSEMAGSDEYRAAFAANCKKTMDEYNLDGIDIDWEYPTSNMAAISSSPEDTDNFTLLMRDLRAAMGDEGILTFATPTPGLYYNYADLVPYVSFVNLMGYDINQPPYHHAGLYRSEHTDRISIEESVNLHLEKGIPAEKLVLGLPFYGHVADGVDLKDGARYSNLAVYEGPLTRMWDDVAKAPYFANENGELVVSYEDTVSIGYKCKFMKEKNLLGAMYWEYSGDNEAQDLLRTLYNGVME